MVEVLILRMPLQDQSAARLEMKVFIQIIKNESPSVMIFRHIFKERKQLKEQLEKQRRFPFQIVLYEYPI